MCVCVCVGGGGNITDYYRIWGHASSPPEFFFFFLVFSCSETASGAIGGKIFYRAAQHLFYRSY